MIFFLKTGATAKFAHKWWWFFICKIFKDQKKYSWIEFIYDCIETLLARASHCWQNTKTFFFIKNEICLLLFISKLKQQCIFSKIKTDFPLSITVNSKGRELKLLLANSSKSMGKSLRQKSLSGNWPEVQKYAIIYFSISKWHALLSHSFVWLTKQHVNNQFICTIMQISFWKIL